MKALQLKIPPPIITIIFAVFMWIVAKITPNISFSFPFSQVLSLIFFILGGLISFIAMYSFFAVRTTLNSTQLDSTSSFVVSGIYSCSRNPMYVGLLFVLIGWSIHLSNILTLLFIPLFILCINYLQIKPEEKALGSKFGQAFILYKSRVRRWL